MRVLHLVGADRWTGAAAVALQLVEALRAAGCDAQLAFRPGDTLERRLADRLWAHPVLPRERGLADLRKAVATVRGLAAPFAAVHCHLPHDHALARVALGGGPPAQPRARLVRSIRHPRHLRRDPFHLWLFRRTDAAALANSGMAAAWRRLDGGRERPAVVLPPAAGPPFAPGRDGGKVRRLLEIPGNAVVAGTVGKLHRQRGQDLLLHALAAAPRVWGLIVGAGEYRTGLERLAGALGVGARVRFAGYVEEGLADHYAAMDLFVFPAAGSDWGHRSIAEASSCGLPTVAADLPGVRDLVQEGITGSLYPATDAAALAVVLRRWAGDGPRRSEAGRAAARRAAREWTPAALASAAATLYPPAGPHPPGETHAR